VFFAVQALDASNAWMVGIDSIALRTQDGGTTWEKVNTGIKRVLPFYGVHFADPDRGVISGQGVMVFTSDGGKTWQNSSFNSTIEYTWLHGVSSASNSSTKTLWAVGDHGRVFQSVDYGKQWTEIALTK